MEMSVEELYRFLAVKDQGQYHLFLIQTQLSPYF
jgi:hypothetical protein